MTRFFVFLKWTALLAVIASLTACGAYSNGMLNPKGFITFEERKLFFDTLALMLIVVIPVIIMSLTFVYHYRASHRTDQYKPNWSHSYFLESLWWGIPFVIILVLGILTLKKTHELDPYRPVIGHHEKPLMIQVIALPWKWLFIYPEQNIATVNYLEVPVGQQIEFWITADNAPMSAFFIPQLGSQIYAMSGMRTRLFLSADQTGDFLGMNTLFNGDGFAEMQFVTHVVTPEQMTQWVNNVKKSHDPLTDAIYTTLLTPTINDKSRSFSEAPTHLFYNVINTYQSSTGRYHPRSNGEKWIKES